MAVITTFKLDDVFAPGKGARQPYGGHGGFRARADKAHLVHRRKSLKHRFRQLCLSRCTGTEARAVPVGFLYGFHDRRESMPKDQRPPGANIVDVLITVSIPDARSQSANDVR